MQINKIKILYLLLLLGPAPSLFCLKISLANIHVFSHSMDIPLNDQELNTTKKFYQLIKTNEFEGLLKLQMIGSTYLDNATVQSSLQASELCELLQIDYLLYGFIEKTGRYYDAEIRLFNNESKEDLKIFYFKQELGSYDQFLSQLSAQLVAYLYQILGLSEEQKARHRGFGGIGIYNAVGYWIPLPKWWQIITGIIAIESGFTVIPLTYFARTRNFQFSMRFSLMLSYGLGINKPDLLRSYLHTLTIKFPLEFCFEFYFNHAVLVGMGPDLVIDFLYQELIYDAAYTKQSIAVGAFTSLKYEYWFGRKKWVALGLSNTFQFTFYEQFLVQYQLQIYHLVRIPMQTEKSKRAGRAG